MYVVRVREFSVIGNFGFVLATGSTKKELDLRRFNNCYVKKIKLRIISIHTQKIDYRAIFKNNLKNCKLTKIITQLMIPK